MIKKFEFLGHTSEVKFRAYGKSVNELFESCALAVSSVLSRGMKIKEPIKKEINVYGKDKESMLYKFIEEIIYLFDADGFIVSKAKVNVEGKSLNAVFYGDESVNYKDLDAIKSPTYAEMYVKNNGKKWECQVVLDV
ncbi:MAG: archease [Nanoarchaeota archaeon]